MKRALGITAFAAVMAAGFLRAPSAVAAEGETRFISVIGQGEVKTEPDQAMLSLGVETTDMDLKTAQQENARRSQKLVDALKKLKIAAADIQTEMVQIQPRYQFDQRRRRFDGYVVRKNFTVVMKDLSAYGQVIDAAITAGVEHVGQFRFQTSRLAALREEARKRAAEDAKTKAAALAGHLGQKIGAPLSIEEHAAGSPVRSMRAAAMGMMEASVVEDTVEPGEITIQATVAVKFALE